MVDSNFVQPKVLAFAGNSVGLMKNNNTKKIIYE